MNATALIAEDEPLLAQALQAGLARAWPALRILATVGDGLSAVTETLAHRPQVLFFDIRMPGQSGLEAAAELADAWPQDPGAPPFPALVFVTAYDQYAVQAFEAQAVDYLLKPVEAGRLQNTVQRLQHLLAATAQNTLAAQAEWLRTAAQLRQLRQLLSAHAPAGQAPLLRHIQAGVGSQIRLVPVDEVLYFEAADKYLRVVTADAELLIRTPLKALLPQLDPQAFWQVHRGTVVRVGAIDSVQRDATGRLQLRLRGSGDKLAVSRLYADLFRAM